MNSIILHIKTLLIDYDCVIVPHFGGFLCNYTPAQIKKSDDTLNPPIRIVSFNRNLTQNDGLLIGKISETKSITYEESQAIVEAFVSKIKKQLDSGEIVSFDEIGSFSLNKEGNIQFNPYNSFNYNLDAFGLTSFKYEPLKRYSLDSPTPLDLTPYAAEESTSGGNIRKILLRSAAVVIPAALIVGAFLFHNNLTPSLPEKSSFAPIYKAEKIVSSIETTTPSTVATSNSSQNIGENIIDSTSDSKTELSVSLSEAMSAQTVYSSDIYSVVIGSFKVEENAIDLSHVLQSKGFETVVSGSDNGFYRVEVGKYPSIDIASEQRDTMSAEYPGAWVKRVIL